MLNQGNSFFNQSNLVGMNIADFGKKFPDRNSWRIASFNGQTSQPPSDSNPKRANLYLQSGIITKVTWG